MRLMKDDEGRVCEVIKADTWYWCRDGKLVEVDEDDG